jgi:hypothetical protein
MLRHAVICLITLATCAQAATHTDSATKLHFPDSLGAWKRTSVHVFPEPGLGKSVSYQHPSDGVVTIYIYNKQQPKIPTGATNDIVQAEFATVLEEIEALYANQKYENLRRVLTAEPAITVGDKLATLLAAVYSFSNPEWHPPQQMSFALLTGYRNRFLKLRYSFPGDPEKTPERGQAELKALISAFVDANKKNVAAFWQTDRPAAKPAVTKEMVQAAIENFRKDPLPAIEQGTARTIMNFGEASSEVSISLSSKVVPWLGGKMDERRSLLLAAYVAGNLESQLKEGKKANDSLAGIQQAITTYRQLQKADANFRVEELEKLIAIDAEGGLKAYLESKSK